MRLETVIIVFAMFAGVVIGLLLTASDNGSLRWLLGQ